MMADTRSLRFIGLAYGAVAAMVGLIAVIVVSGHLLGAMTLDDSGAQTVKISAIHR